MDSPDPSLDAALSAHDEALSACGLEVWIGAEPTFTDRFSESPEWLSEALGDSKQQVACRIIQRLRDAGPDALILRTVGRQYPGEPQPRWSLGLYRRRDGGVIADGLPPDPLSGAAACSTASVTAFWEALCGALDRDGWRAAAFRTAGDMPLRLLCRCDGRQPATDTVADPRLARPALHSRAIPAEGVADELANEGAYLVTLGCAPTGRTGGLQLCLELPAFDEVPVFLDFVRRVALAAQASGLEALVWRGYPPPVDTSVSWATLTPDPAVLEVNEAPAASVGEFYAMSRRLYAVAAAEGLAAYRLQYNGNISDSGGGGQFTLGGPSPARSPFFIAPQLLTRLVAYFNHHPALSYWFAPPYVGSYSQAPRADENVQESFSELQVALQHLAASEAPQPEFIWRSLSPFLVDTSGNAHRSELNIEKLWNPYLPGRGCLGLVELRAFRMPVDAETAACIAALLRALTAMLARQEGHLPLREWGSTLHDRFALPFYLRHDLQAVFDDLQAAGLGLAAPITARLCADDWRHLGDAEIAGWRVSIEQAIEFWPLLGDAAEQAGGSRLVDASTSRLQLSLRPAADTPDLDGWQLLAAGYRLPLRREQDERGTLFITGLRYRAFVPWAGLHPGLEAQTPVVLTLVPPGGDDALRITLHDWQPQDRPYDGLPRDLDQARQRIDERCVVETLARTELPVGVAPPQAALSDYCFDLRRV